MLHFPTRLCRFCSLACVILMQLLGLLAQPGLVASLQGNTSLDYDFIYYRNGVKVYLNTSTWEEFEFSTGNYISSDGLSPNGQYVIVNIYGTQCVADSTLQPVTCLANEVTEFGLAGPYWLPDSQSFWTFGDDVHIRHIDVASGSAISSISLVDTFSQIDFRNSRATQMDIAPLAGLAAFDQSPLTGDNTLYIADLSSSQIIQSIFVAPNLGEIKFSTDETQLAYIRDCTGRRLECTTSLNILDLSPGTSQSVELVINDEALFPASNLFWSNNNQMIGFFAITANLDLPIGTVVYDLATQQLRLLSESRWEGASKTLLWSPDDEAIAKIIGVRTPPEVSIIILETGEEIILVDPSTHEGTASGGIWVPRGWLEIPGVSQ